MHNNPGMLDLNIRKLAVQFNRNFIGYFRQSLLIQLVLDFMFVYSLEHKKEISIIKACFHNFPIYYQ